MKLSSFLLLLGSSCLLLLPRPALGEQIVVSGSSSAYGWGDYKYCHGGPIHGICSSGSQPDCFGRAFRAKCEGGDNFYDGGGSWHFNQRGEFSSCEYGKVAYGLCASGENKDCDFLGIEYNHGLKCGWLKSNRKYSSVATRKKASNQETVAECDTGWYVVEFCGSDWGYDCLHSDGNRWMTVVTCQKMVCTVGHNAHDDCNECPKGTFNNDHNGVTGCSDCPAGKYSSSTKSTSCSTCAAGKYSSAGASSCTNCPSGKYSTQSSGFCQNCDAGKIPNSGKTACNQCTGNTYAKQGDSSCTECPAGTTAKADNSGCDDVDECAGSHECPTNSDCVNIELSEAVGGNPYKCRCVAGFSVEESGGTQFEGQPNEMTCEGVTIPLEASHIAYDSITIRIQHSVVDGSGTSVTVGCFEPVGFTNIETLSSDQDVLGIVNRCKLAGYKYAGRKGFSSTQVWCSNTYPTGAKISSSACGSQGWKLHVVANRDYQTFEFDLEIGRSTSEHESEKIFRQTKTLQELEAGITLHDLDPGTPYLYQLKSVGTESTVTAKRVTTTCECHHASETHLQYAGLDHPWDFEPTQEQGFVTFQFRDLSRCEEGFSLTRKAPSDDEEQVFTSTYYYVSSLACGEHLTLGPQNADDLSLAQLPVGIAQRYCVQAVGPGNGGIRYTSVGDSCFDHQVLWEASIDGIARLPQHSGSLPVQGVIVKWKLMRKSIDEIILGGSLTTDRTGKYHIELKSDHPDLFTVDGLNEDVEVRITFLKTTSTASAPLDHTFVCDDGESICSGGSWTSVYVRHLDFGVEHEAVDLSSNAITGKVVIGGTGRTTDPNDPPADFAVDPDTECPIIGADVCLQVMNLEVDAGERNCVKSDAEGNFELAAPLGTKVKVEVDYFQHEFNLDQDNYAYDNDEDGFLIEEEPAHAYTNFKFTDVHKAPLRTHVVGGLCERLLGDAQLIVTLPSCSHWKGQPFYQSGIMQEHNMPAHDVDVKAFIQGRNDIDMESQGFDLRQVVVEHKASHEDGMLSREGQEGLEKEPEEADMLRFQYNGTVEVQAHFTGDTADTAGAACSNTGTGDSFHVLEAYEGFTLMVKVSQSFGGDIENCDHIPDDTKVQITSELGPDETNDAKFISELEDGIFAEYMRCSGPDADGLCIYPKCCLLDIEHTETSDGAGGTIYSEAKVTAKLRAGPPNIAGEFLKSMLIEVDGVSHRATVLLHGDFEVGDPERLPLPAMDPIMILRDPPGSNSYAYYENIATTGFVSIEGYSSYYGMHSKYDTSVGGDVKSSTCAGVGAMACQETVAVEIGESADDAGGGDNVDRKRKLLSYESDMKILMSHQGETSESSFETTWSYQTPENWAGHEVDYFVVPSISLVFHEVIEISVEPGTCRGVKEEKVKFSAESESKENSVAFLSFADVAKLLFELNDLQDMLQGIIDDPQETVDRHEAAIDTLPIVTQGLSKWATIVAEYQKVNEFDSSVNMVNPADWFKTKADKCEDEMVHWAMNYVPDGYGLVEYSNECKNYLAKNFPSSHWSSLIPEGLKGHMKDEGMLSENEDVHSLNIPEDLKRQIEHEAMMAEFEDVHLLKFSGGGGKFVYELNETFSMDKERLPESIVERGIKGVLDMIPGMSVATNGGHSANSIARTVVDTGVKLKAKALWFKKKYSTYWGGDINTIKTSFEHKLSSQSSKVGFVLEDKDIGDYFDVKVGIDPIYGSFVFKTVGGLSKCWHEEGTTIREQPEIDIISKPTSEILPDQPGVFQVKLRNRGKTWNEYDLAIARKNNTGGLAIHVNGAPLGVDQLYRFEALEEVPITVSVFRGPVSYEYEPVQLQLRSRCERTKFATYDLFTHLNANNKAVIRYAQDCPRMVLDGQLGSGIFMINANMDREAPLLVQNRQRSVRGSLQEMDVLTEVLVKYRKFGTAGTWNNARVGVDGTIVDLDLRNSPEDAYGFVSDTWPLDQLVDGTYEVMVESKCPGNPAEFQKAHSEISIIKLDTIPPEPFAFPSDTDTYHVGEPLIFEYDESLDCERPYGFGLDVTVSNVLFTFTEENMLVVCEDRMIGIQFDGSQFDLDLLKGETAKVTLSDVRDPNVNTATNDAVVTVTFAAEGNRAFRRLTAVPSIKAFQRTNVTALEPLSNSGAAMIRAKFAEVERQNIEMAEGIKRLIDRGGRNDEYIKKLVLEEMEAMDDRVESLYQMGMIFMCVLLAFMLLVVSLLVWKTKRPPANSY